MISQLTIFREWAEREIQSPENHLPSQEVLYSQQEGELPDDTHVFREHIIHTWGGKESQKKSPTKQMNQSKGKEGSRREGVAGVYTHRIND